MREPPPLSGDRLIACLREGYDDRVRSVRFLPRGYDPNASVFAATTDTDDNYFVKVRSGPINPAALLVPRLLVESGIPNILAPLRTRTGGLWMPLDGSSVVVYPFIRGENAMTAGLSDIQWREFGATLRAIHTGDFPTRLRGQVARETFSLPSARLVRELTEELPRLRLASPAARHLADFWKAKIPFLESLLTRAETLGRELQTRSLPPALCHGDIHAANILVGEDGGITLADWDGPLLAPRERDLLFVVGSTIARRVEPHEEVWFFEGYGAADVNHAALAYYRYERAIEDIGEFGKSVFHDAGQSEAAKSGEAEILRNLFAPGQIIASALEADRQSGGDPPAPF